MAPGGVPLIREQEARHDAAVVLYRPIAEADLSFHAALLDHAFSENPTGFTIPPWQQQAATGPFRRCGQADQVAAGMGTSTIGSVVEWPQRPNERHRRMIITPEFQGSGVASYMMRSAMEEMRPTASPSRPLRLQPDAIYPEIGYQTLATPSPTGCPMLVCQPRRSNGWWCRWRRRRTSRRCTLYAEQAQQPNERLDRHPVLWESLLRERPPGQRLHGGGQGRGRLRRLRPDDDDPSDPGKVIKVEDLVAVTSNTGRQLLSFLGGHRRVADHLRRPAADPLAAPGYRAGLHRVGLQQWTLALDVPAAL